MLCYSHLWHWWSAYQSATDQTDGSLNWQKKWSREIAAEIGIPSFFMKSRCELKEDEEEEEEEVDQVTYNSNSTACASSDSDSSIHQGTQDSKQLPVGPTSYSVWWHLLLRFPYHTSYNYSFQVQMWNVCSCITKDSEFLQILAEIFEGLMDWVSQHANTEWDSPGQYKADSVIIYIRHKHKKQFPSQQLTRTRLR